MEDMDIFINTPSSQISAKILKIQEQEGTTKDRYSLNFQLNSELAQIFPRLEMLLPNGTTIQLEVITSSKSSPLLMSCYATLDKKTIPLFPSELITKLATAPQRS